MKINTFILLFFISLVIAQDKGQKLYKEGKFDEARSYYEHILLNREKDDAARFGLGVSAYQQKDMETASQVFNDVMSTNDKSLQSKALYNIGTLFNEQKKVEESLAFFKKAIESDPLNEDAKFNYELLKRHLQNQQQDQQQNANQDQDSEDNQDQAQENQDNNQKNMENQDQGQSESDGKKDQQKQENQKDQVEQGDEKDKDIVEKHEAVEKAQDKENEPKTDKQIQAEAILDALKDQEKINQKRQISKSKSKKLEKDW